MKEHPILYKGRLIRALFQKRKTETRRVGPNAKRWLKAEAGDHVWARETFMPLPLGEIARYRRLGLALNQYGGRVGYVYQADIMQPAMDYLATDGRRWVPNIHMPRKACRLVHELVEKPWLEPLQDLTEVGARAEGVERHPKLGWVSLEAPGGNQYEATALDAFQALWNSINEPRGYGWRKNPHVVVLRFKPVRAGFL